MCIVLPSLSVLGGAYKYIIFHSACLFVYILNIEWYENICIIRPHKMLAEFVFNLINAR